uniref:Uncharacterized protein n=1 Tax=Ciona savignyi TaxID=51511 RepID=H2ZPU9_CIOSA
DGVVWLNNSGRYLRSWVNGELQFRFFAVIYRKSLHEKRGKTGPSSSSERVEDEETLEASALIRQLSDSVEHKVNDFLTDGVVTTGIVVGGILFAGNQLFRVKELAVS